MGFTGTVDFLFVLVLLGCNGAERFDNDTNVLSLLDVDERTDIGLVTRDVIIAGVVLGSDDVLKDKDEGDDIGSLPILEHV